MVYPFDIHQDGSYSTLTNSPGASGTTFDVTTGTGSRFSVDQWVAWRAVGTALPVEYGQITAIATDSLTVTRAQRGSTALNVASGWEIYGGVFAEDLQTIEELLNASYSGWLNEEFWPTSSNLGVLNWAHVGTTITNNIIVAGHPGVINVATSSASASTAAVYTFGAFMDPVDSFSSWFIASPGDVTNGQYWFGWKDSGAATDPSNGMYFRYTTGNWFAVCRNGGVETAVDTGVTPVAGSWYTFRIRRVDSGTIGFSINGGTEKTITTNIPSAGTGMWAHFDAYNYTSAVAVSYEADAFRYLVQGLAR